MQNIIGFKLDRAFGPVGFFAGIVLVIVGIVVSIYSLPAITLIIIGAFTAFTESYTYLDPNAKRIRLSYNFFGIFKSGQWLELDPNMKIGIKKTKKFWKSYSRSNKEIKVPNVDFRLTLYNYHKREIMTVKKYDTYEDALNDLEKMKDLLGVSLME
jgi:uncharacterized membrane protein YgaE (UPF0421/DUF939 family)